MQNQQKEGAVVGGLIGATGGAIAAYGALSAGGTAFITGSITIAAKMTEVGALQGRKSQSEGDNGWQIANDCVDSIFRNTFKVISPIGTKTLTTATTFWVTDIAKHKVAPLTAEAFLKGPCGKLLPYGLATYGVLHTVYAFFCADPVERANQRGYGLK